MNLHRNWVKVPSHLQKRLIFMIYSIFVNVKLELSCFLGSKIIMTG